MWQTGEFILKSCERKGQLTSTQSFQNSNERNREENRYVDILKTFKLRTYKLQLNEQRNIEVKIQEIKSYTRRKLWNKLDPAVVFVFVIIFFLSGDAQCQVCYNHLLSKTEE